VVVSELQVRPDKPYRLAVGSFKEDTHNYVEIIQRECSRGPMASRRQPLMPCHVPDTDGRHNSTTQLSLRLQCKQCGWHHTSTVLKPSSSLHRLAQWGHNSQSSTPALAIKAAAGQSMPVVFRHLGVFWAHVSLVKHTCRLLQQTQSRTLLMQSLFCCTYPAAA